MNTIIEHIPLPDDRFVDKQLDSLTLKNIFFGKNGVGKTTITNQIRNMDSNLYDIHIFDGWHSIIAQNSMEEGLDPILLIGSDNIDIQKDNKNLKNKIKKQDNIIQNYKNTITDKENLSKQHRNQLNKEYKNSATDIFNTLPGLPRNFNRTSVENYNSQSDDLLSPEDEQRYFEILNEKNKTIEPYIINQQLNNADLFNFEDIHHKLEQVLSKQIISVDPISVNSLEEEEWINQGIKLTITDHESPITCLFCDQEIPKKRVDLLNNFFNKELDKLEKDINTLKTILKEKKDIITKIDNMNANDVYIQFDSQRLDLNHQLSELIKLSLSFIFQSLELLDQKSKYKFSPIEMNKLKTPSWSHFLSELSKFKSQIQNYSNNINIQRDQAKEKLLHHYIYKAKSRTEVIELNSKIVSLNQEIETIQEEIDKQNTKKKDLENEINNNLKKYSSEYELVKIINKYLLSVGIESFSLEYVKNDKFEAYKIAGYDKKIRNIEQLSDGEKNLIAFLWFVNKVKSIRENSEKDQVIVFDDPINSNDDRIQYLVICILRKMLSEASKNRSQFFIFTHNIHFYMQILVGRKRYNHDNANLLIIEKTGNHRSKIKNVTANNDIQTVYDTLWDELIFSKENRKAFLMFNTMRRILESYASFMFPKNGLGDLSRKIHSEQEEVIYKSFLLMLHNGSHEAGEVDISKFGLGNDDVEELLRIFQDIFSSMGEESKKHFDQHIQRAKESHNNQT